MALIKPSMTLVLDLDERSAKRETVLEIKRSYTHITTPLVRTHAGRADEPATNTMRIIVALGASDYLHSAVEGADDRWSTIVEPWLGSMLYKIGNNMRVFNDRQRSIKLDELIFDRFEIVLQGGAFTVCLHPDAQCDLSADLKALAGQARALLNSGVLEGAVRVTAPTDESFAQQNQTAWDAWVVEHPEALEEPETEPEPEVETEPEPEKSYEERMREDIIAKSYENTAVAPTDSPVLPPVGEEEEEEEEEEERFNFAVDYSLWSVEFADGFTKVFDSAAERFVD